MPFETLTEYLAALFSPLKYVFFAYALSGPGGEADAALTAQRFGLRDAPGSAGAAWEDYARAEESIAERVRAGVASGVIPPFERVCAVFGLNAFERFALALTLAAETDPVYAAAVAWENGLTRQRLLCLYAASFEECAACQIEWLADAQKLRLLFTEAETNGPLALRPGIRHFLLGVDMLPEDVSLFDPASPLPEAALACETEETFAQQLAAYPKGNIFVLTGPRGTGKTDRIKRFVHESGVPLLIVSHECLRDDGDWADQLAATLVLTGGFLCINGLPDGGLSEKITRLVRRVKPDNLFLTGEDLCVSAPEGYRCVMAAMAPEACFCWEDLILPPLPLSRLHHICNQVRYRDRVYHEWGFGAVTPYGRGVRALFSGPPGTGKTMAAQVMAAALGRKLYKVNLSSLVSKYIGDTEKNLDTVFAQAEKNGGILFFDEADAIFGRRGEQKDSHDKYANLQTAFLLQRFEDFNGMVLLATNLLSNIDPAFARRIQNRVDFPIPSPEYRRRIWERLLHNGLPLTEEIDTAFLADKFELTGAAIKNIVTQAAFLAAPEGRGVGMGELIDALVMEYAKADKIISRQDLGEYGYHGRDL